jgi:hypothetical protein
VQPVDTGADGVRAAWEDDGVVVVVGTALPELLAIVPGDALRLGPDLMPTAGSWKRDGDIARFIPRFAAVGGTIFAVVGRQDATQGWSELARVVSPGAQPARTTVVEAIDPGCDQVPANLLRFSVTFSETMEEGTAAGRIHLHDASGAELPGTLLEMPPELWDRARRRLTVLLEPGRIKRGLQPNVQAGPPLREGATVSVVIDADIRDAAGAELAAGAQRSYRVGAAMRSRVDPARWDVRWPESLDDPLVIRFDRPLDRTLAQRFILLMDGHGQPVQGRASLDENSSVWVFTPAGWDGAGLGSAWSLHVDTRLEDLAGNSVRRVFDRDVQWADDDSVDASSVVLTPDGRVERRP